MSNLTFWPGPDLELTFLWCFLFWPRIWFFSNSQLRDHQFATEQDFISLFPVSIHPLSLIIFFQEQQRLKHRALWNFSGDLIPLKNQKIYFYSEFPLFNHFNPYGKSSLFSHYHFFIGFWWATVLDVYLNWHITPLQGNFRFSSYQFRI